MRSLPMRIVDAALVAVLVVGAVWIGLTFTVGSYVRDDRACTACHSMSAYASAHRESAHAGVKCVECHGSQGRLSAFADGVSLERMVLAARTAAQHGAVRVTEGPCVRCHGADLVGTIEAHGMRVKHAEFSELRCAECHAGTGHAMKGRLYAVPEMESCMGCHRVAATEVNRCGMCHSKDAARAQRVSNSSWRITHGPTWRKTHGMGELSTCRSCHEAGFCVRCHRTPIPHAAEWAVSHGRGQAEDDLAACASCHKQRFCDDCHGLRMPHADGFLRVHAASAEKSGVSTCVRCHAKSSCDACHTKARHKDVEGVDRAHEVKL